MAYLGFGTFVQYAVTGGSTVGFGNIQGGEWGGLDQEAKQMLGAAGKNDVIWGMVFGRDTINALYKGESILTACARTVYDGLPPYLLTWGGVVNASASMSSKCTSYVDTVTLKCGGIGESVEVDYGLIHVGRKKCIATAGNVVAPTATAPFIWARGAVTIDGAAYNCQSYEASLKNNLKCMSSLDAASSNLRWPEEIVTGDEETSLRVVIKAPLAVDLGLDAPTMPITCSFLVGNGYTTKTLTMRQLYLVNQPTKIEQGANVVLWDLSLDGLKNCLSASTTGTAAWSVV